VLSYVGPGPCLFVTPVCKAWKEVYGAVASQQLAVWDEDTVDDITITCVPQMTLFSSVFAAPSRVQLAHESGLDCSSEAYQRAAGKYANTAALATAYTLGVEFTEEAIIGAVNDNKLAEVQYLHNQGCPWPEHFLEFAASSGYFELVRWCYEHGCFFILRITSVIQHCTTQRRAVVLS
jgi:hypothetical protein